jgi:hypothetical protein
MHNNGKIIAEGHLNPYTGKYDVNTSSVFSEILRSLRYCDNYLSDVLYDIEKIRTLIEGGKGGVVWLGFRKDGVDGVDYIRENLKDTNRMYHYYRDIIRVDVVFIERTETVSVVLEHSDHLKFREEDGKNTK